jgi:hypothetical protein
MSARSNDALLSWLVYPRDPVAHQGERHRGEGQVRGDVGRTPELLRRVRLPVVDRVVEHRPPPRLRIVHERRTLRGAGSREGRVRDLADDRTAVAAVAGDRAAEGRGRAGRGRMRGVGARMLDPLGLAGLPRDHGDRIRGRGRVLGGEDVVEDRETAGISPEERNGVAVDVRHHQFGELRALLLARGVTRFGVIEVLIE